MKHYVETPFFPAVHNTTVHHPRCRKNGLKTCGKLPVVITPMYSFVPSGAGMSGFGKNTIGMTLTVSVIWLMKTGCVLLSNLCRRPHRIGFLTNSTVSGLVFITVQSNLFHTRHFTLATGCLVLTIHKCDKLHLNSIAIWRNAIKTILHCGSSTPGMNRAAVPWESATVPTPSSAIANG